MPTVQSARSPQYDLEPPNPDECEGANCSAPADVPFWFCTSCDSTYCDLCWHKQGPHRKGKLGPHGLPHEKTDKLVYQRLQAVFRSPETEQELADSHYHDMETLWLGIEHRENSTCRFTTTSRSSTLMAQTKRLGVTDRYPLLVSFIGETGAGKSTLIKMLVDLPEPDIPEVKHDLYKSPVTGSVKNDRSPTSGDVHLYIDPQTAHDTYPVLYADCEGLEGGEAAPTANMFRAHLAKAKKLKINTHRSYEEKSHDFSMPPNSATTGVRETAVKDVFPRILYTFSDVVVFVLKNTRKFESGALKLLLEWAATSIESSVNQPTLPHVIIVLNASDDGIDHLEWDVDIATDRLLDHHADAIRKFPLKQYADKWIGKGKTLKNTRDLIKCYYADVRVVRMPMKGRHTLIHQQVERLHTELVKSCNASFTQKWEARQQCTDDEFVKYLQAGIAHFTTKQQEPFNFMEVALSFNPIPQSFEDHMLALMWAFADKGAFGLSTRGLGSLISLSPLIASYIFLDCRRYRRPGQPEVLFDKYYAPSCSKAIEIFANRHMQCAFKSSKGKACVNSKFNHEKGHQTSSGSIFSGGFTSSYDLQKLTQDWLQQTRQTFLNYDMEFRAAVADARGVRTSDKIAHELHYSNVRGSFGSFANRIEDKQTCYGCLMEVPQHPLRCKHVLCTLCVKMLGRVTDTNTVTIDECPFEMKNSAVRNPCDIRFKPDFAGVRILSLDGGGMRGIVELECLRAIERVLGERLPVQAFFDLIVGTSTGGIIAIGLGVKQWRVEDCVARFTDLVKKAFRGWYTNNVPTLRKITLAVKRAKYRTKPFRAMLRTELGTDHLYGQITGDFSGADTKVCVIAASQKGDAGIAIGNYTRQSEEDHWYKFQAGDTFEVWQAAAATSAAPRYFRSYSHETTAENGMACDAVGYLDGAIYFNNPVRVAYYESRYIWPDMANRAPDLVLSIGTGKHGSTTDEAVQRERYTKNYAGRVCTPDRVYWQPTSGKAAKSGWSKYIEFLKTRIDVILDAEKEFKRFQADATHCSDLEVPERYVRLNPDLGQTPAALDEIDKMKPLQDQVASLLRSPGYELMIERITYRMIASTFYFQKLEIETDKDSGEFVCWGRIACRFEGNDSHRKNLLRNLGSFLRRQATADFRPFLTIKQEASDSDNQKIELTRQVIEHMVDDADFRIAENLSIIIPNKQTAINIYLCLKPNRVEPELYPLSGFPRLLLTEDDSTASHLQKRSESIRNNIRSSQPLVGRSRTNLPERTFSRQLSSMLSRESVCQDRRESDSHDHTILSTGASDSLVSERNSETITRVADQKQLEHPTSPKPDLLIDFDSWEDHDTDETDLDIDEEISNEVAARSEQDEDSDSDEQMLL